MTIHPHGTTLIDAAVAKIVGLPGMIDSGNVFRTTGNAHDDWLGNGSSVNAEWTMEWNPSGDMRYAMEAADKCGVFCNEKRFLWHNGTEFVVGEFESGLHLFDCDVIGRGETPALAICLAILALHGDK